MKVVEKVNNLIDAVFRFPCGANFLEFDNHFIITGLVDNLAIRCSLDRKLFGLTYISNNFFVTIDEFVHIIVTDADNNDYDVVEGFHSTYEKVVEDIVKYTELFGSQG